ncbi:Putative glycosyltransferases [Roseimaritima multifibrata]|uniref:Glycosyltransferases n=1 Tax=Roseimaritima multifibrata TaxID=1930274 RepID=A0A517MGG5_9BACT|nr:glycosyltransferase [Roseimaritima multifibrata]QDS93857.1 Putative glycosyltransferases [Roseimaritima multifibrata]
MPSLPTKLSIVLPVRNAEPRIANEVWRVLTLVADVVDETVELIIVDDGSMDRTTPAVNSLRLRHPELRVMRHVRPRGLEAAGQTGLERATGELIFIQESDTPMVIEDFCKLYATSSDSSIVAARLQTVPQEIEGPLERRLRAAGTNADLHYRTTYAPGLQMIRRSHLQQLAGPNGKRLQLHSGQLIASDSSEYASRASA